VEPAVSEIVYNRVVGGGLGMHWWTRWTALPKREVGQSKGSRVRRWVLESIRMPFFWSRHVTVTNSERWSNLGSWWEMMRRRRSQKTRSRSSIVLVRPGSFVRTISHGLVAKKKPPMRRSTAWSMAQGLTVGDPRRCKCRKNFGVMAFC
jgi:hypothetical protein